MVTTLRALMLLLFVVLTSQSAQGQTPAPPIGKPTTPGLIKLTGEDEKRAKQLDEHIEKALKTDRWDEASANAEEAVTLRRRVQGPKHFETITAEWRQKTLRQVAAMPDADRLAWRSARTMNEQGAAHVGAGKDAQAQALFEKALEIDRRLLGDDHLETAECENNLAVSLDDQGKYAQAQPLLEKSLSIRRRLLGDDHPDTAESYSNLAFNLNEQGKYAQAQELYEKSLEICRRSLPEDDLAIARCYNSLAYNLDDQGKYGAAQALYEKALAIRRQKLTDNHPDTARIYNNLATNLDAQGKSAAALPLHEKALEIRRRLLTEEHPDTAASFTNIALNLMVQGKYAQAQPVFEKALELHRRLLTDLHPNTAKCYHNLALNLNYQGQFAQAQPLYEKALELHRQLFTDRHPHTALCYNDLALNLKHQGNYAAAQPLFEKALEISRGVLTDNHPGTGETYIDLASNLDAQGRLTEAQPLLEKGLAVLRRRLGDDDLRTARGTNSLANNLSAQGKHTQAQPLYEKVLGVELRLHAADHPRTATSYNNLAASLNAQGKFLEARDRWRSAARSLDGARVLLAFAGMERAGTNLSVRPPLAALSARLGQPEEAWQQLEEDLGRGLLDELAARQDRRLAPGERARLRELTDEIERLDRLVETTPKDLDQAGRARRFEDLKHKRDLASIALGEFQSKLLEEYGPLAGRVSGLKEIQAALPADAAFVAWVDIPPAARNSAVPDGEHWGVVIRSRGIPVWVPIAGTGPKGLWTKDDNELAGRVRKALQIRPVASSADLAPLIEKLRTQRLEPLASALGPRSDGLPPARRLIVLPSRAMAGIPVEALLPSGEARMVSYAPSATIFKYLREQPRPGRNSGLLALGDPVYERPDQSGEPKPPPDHGLLVNLVAPGSNAATHGVKPGDVLLAYNGMALHSHADLKVATDPGKPIPVEIWRAGQTVRRDLDPGKLGVVIDRRPAPVVIAEQRNLQQILVAARSGDKQFAPLPGTRYEVEALAKLFQSDDRPTMPLFGVDASEATLDRLATSGELSKFGYIHLAAHGVIDEAIPLRSAVILTQTGLPDPLEQVLNHKPVFDGRLTVREIQRTWDLKAELVTLSACETALGRGAGGEGFVGFTQALLMSGARSLCLSLWKVDDTATALLMHRFYANLLGRRSGLSQPLPKAEALAEAKVWLRGLGRDDVARLAANLSSGEARAKGAEKRNEAPRGSNVAAAPGDDHPYAHPYYWAAFVLVGNPD
jgi:tetratricopeptide (TPR) repeat protein